MTAIAYYRYDDNQYGTGEPTLSEFWAVKHTPKGAWIVGSWAATQRMVLPLEARTVKELRDDWGARFVLDGKGRRYAYPSLEDAKASYRIRKVRQIQHARNAIEKAEKALAWCDGKLDELAALPAYLQFT